MSENRQVAGQLTWHGMGGDDSVDGPLSSILQELATVGGVQAFVVTDMRVDPLVHQDPWVEARRRRSLSRERPAQSTASSWGSQGPIQMPTAISLGASTVTMDTTTNSATVQAPPVRQPSGELTVREDIQEIVRVAVEALLEERRRQTPGVAQARPVPQIPQLIQTRRGLPGAAAVTAPIPMAGEIMPAGLPRMVQPPTRTSLSEPGRASTTRPSPPNLSALLFGSLQAPNSSPSNSGTVASSSWDNLVDAVARSVSLRHTVMPLSLPTAMPQAMVDQVRASNTAPLVTSSDGIPRDLILVPDDGHFPY